MTTIQDFRHHILGIPYVLQFMRERGFSDTQCLKGSGLHPSTLASDEARAAFHLGQEFTFYRNCLALTGDPAIGLEFGRCFTLERLGMLGLALLSCHSLRQALGLIGKFSMLSYSPYLFNVRVAARTTAISLHPNIEVPDDLVELYIDRDISAGLFCIETACQQNLALDHVWLHHDRKSHRARYEKHFGCPVVFAAPHSEFTFASNALEISMPMNDANMANLCRLQCEQLVARLSKRSSVVDEIRWRILSNPRAFPTLEQMAEQLTVSPRTLRRRLGEEGVSYQAILDEIRYGLAKDYLRGSQLSLQDIAYLLGFAYPGNFTHAFKRWCGVAPRSYRQQAAAGASASASAGD